jgi:hypothetical protein
VAFRFYASFVKTYYNKAPPLHCILALHPTPRTVEMRKIVENQALE